MDLDEGAVAALLGGAPAQRSEVYDRVDPVRRGPVRVPVVLVHGRQDQQVPVEISRRYAAVAGPLCRLIELPDAEHYSIIEPLSSAWPAVVEALSAVVEARTAKR
jgi:pimeloyl-ACP methyl ester carboxylesterase